MKKKKNKKLKYLSVIVYEPTWYVKSASAGGAGGGGGFQYVEKRNTIPTLEYGEYVLYLGEIPNVIGHCAVVKHTGEVVWLVHPQDFREAREDEL